MTQSESLQVFLRFLDQRYEEFTTQLEHMLKTMSANKKDAKLTATRQFLTSASGLALSLAAQDRPVWLKELIDRSEWYVSNYEDENDANHIHLMNIIKHYDEAMNHDWTFSQTDNGSDYSFDDLYKLYRSNSKVEELYDSMVDTLNLMIDSCEIDSVSAISSLSQLIRLINQNTEGSFFSVLATREFVVKFMRNSTWMQIRKIPGVKNYKDNFEKIAKDLDSELDRLHKDIVTEIQEQYDAAIKPVANKNLGRKLVLEVVGED